MMPIAKKLCNTLENSKHEEDSVFASHLLENLISHPSFLPLKASTTVFLTQYEHKYWAKHSNSSLSKHKLL